MKKINYLMFFFILCSCGVMNNTKWTAPPYTNVEKIMSMKPGMTLEEVNQTLGIPPYNIFNIQDDGSMVLLYNYRVKNRRMDVPSDPLTQTDVKNSEAGQDQGQPYYESESNFLYVYFKDRKLKSVISETGIENSEFLMLINNNLKTLTKEDMNKLTMKKVGNYYLVNTKDSTQMVVLNASYFQIEKNKPKNESETFSKNEPKKGKKLLWGVTLALLISIIIAPALFNP